LTQFDEEGNFYVISFASRQLKDHKKNYSYFLLEAATAGDGEIIDSLCDGPCPSCDTENDYFKLNPPKQNFTQKCNNCEEFKKLFLKLNNTKNNAFNSDNKLILHTNIGYTSKLIKLRV
jgi:hypothetical protein